MPYTTFEITECASVPNNLLPLCKVSVVSESYLGSQYNLICSIKSYHKIHYSNKDGNISVPAKNIKRAFTIFQIQQIYVSD